MQNPKKHYHLTIIFLFLTTTLWMFITFPQTTSAAATWHTTCVPEGVVVYTTRVHIKCTAPVGGMSYFAVSTEDKDHVARVLNTLSIAQALGRTVSILYDPAITTNLPPGCQQNDCRTLIAVGFGQ